VTAAVSAAITSDMSHKPFCNLLRAAAAAVALVFTVPTIASAAPPSAEVFARRPAISNLSLSPDGKHIVAITSPDGEATFVSVWRTDALDKPPVATPSGDKQIILGVSFVKNDRLYVALQQTLDTTVTGGMLRTHLIRGVLMGLDGKNVIPLLPPDRRLSKEAQFIESLETPEVLHTLPKDPRAIIVKDSGYSGNDVYKVDVYSGAATRKFLGSEKFFGEATDLAGEVRFRAETDYEDGKVYVAQQIRNPVNDKWEEHFRFYAKDRNPVLIYGFTEDPDVIIISATRSGDRAGLYLYSISQRKVLEPAFEHKLFEASSPIQSTGASDYGRILGFTYGAESQKTYWIDPKLAALSKTSKQALGAKTVSTEWTDPATGQKTRIATAEGFDVEISDFSDDRSVAIAVKEGPKTDAEYYLVKDGKIALLGRARPGVDPTTLGDMRLVQYPARDGLIIPAFLTTPPKAAFGEGPHPAIVLPHGGPWGRDYLGWDFSGWVQYFASRGFVVLQPQFRGSEGWGSKLWLAGDAEWGQKMQDDLDDGAKWLVDQKLAAPDRVALHGYSYGGYAAFAAAVRPNGHYQCAIAGAGVAELASFRADIYDNRFGREYQRPTIKGLQPMREVDKISIPLFVYHGDRDRIVEVKQSREMTGRLKSSGKPYKYLELADMGHTYNTWEPKHSKQVLEAIESYLKTDCGPGGL
jgi:dipeptidyl aminopeptidase/acylaminoacyl peptidase